MLDRKTFNLSKHNMSDAMACIAEGPYNALLLQEQPRARRRRARLQQVIGLMEVSITILLQYEWFHQQQQFHVRSINCQFSKS